jgi:hypothetical protein
VAGKAIACLLHIVMFHSDLYLLMERPAAVLRARLCSGNGLAASAAAAQRLLGAAQHAVLEKLVLQLLGVKPNAEASNAWCWRAFACFF